MMRGCQGDAGGWNGTPFSPSDQLMFGMGKAIIGTREKTAGVGFPGRVLVVDGPDESEVRPL